MHHHPAQHIGRTHGTCRMYVGGWWMLAGAAVGVTLSGCGGGGSDAVAPTLAPPTERASESTDTPHPTPVPGRIGTAAPTTARVPPATPVPGVLGTSPATPAGGDAGVEATSTTELLAPLPTAGSTSTTIAMLAPPECSPAQISASTGVDVAGLSCRGGWATATATPCPPQTACPNRELFHVSADGSGRVEWIHLGSFDTTCAEKLTSGGMTLGTASFLAPVCDPSNVEPVTNIPPGSDDPRVPALQVALISLGYPIALDGTYGAATEAAVRDFQRRAGLEVDGIAGPNTQSALGM